VKIAAITITYNDDYKFEEWYKNYMEYKDQIYLYIIVDNNSGKDYVSRLEKTFYESKIIKRSSNGGCTIAYNDGIRYALNNKEVDAIMLIGNDIKLATNAIKELISLINSDNKIGMVEPILLSKDSNIIEDFGCDITSNLRMKPFALGLNINEITTKIRIVESVTGGMNIAIKSFYEQVGLQDEKLFMYSDEVDMGLRAKKHGFKMAVTSEAKAWHQHINPPGKNIRPAYVGYLIGRNKIYLGYKHFNFIKAFRIFIFHFIQSTGGIVKSVFSKEKRKFHFYFLLGALAGIFRIEKNFNFIISNK